MGRLTQLESQLRRIGSAYSGKWTCALTDLGSGEHIGFDEDDIMPTASLIKVPVLISLYQAVHEGSIRLADRIRYREDHRNVWAPACSFT